MNPVPGEHRGNNSFSQERRTKEGERSHTVLKVTMNNGTKASSTSDLGSWGDQAVLGL